MAPSLDFPLERLICSFMTDLRHSLTHDERKAAEAAFARRPFNPDWSEQARVIYDGIAKALPAPSKAPGESISDREGGGDLLRLAQQNQVGKITLAPAESETESSGHDTAIPAGISYDQAIASGALIDVTPAAKQLGFAFPIAVTKPLWEVRIAPGEGMTEEERSHRLRDVLMAFRLRLAGPPTISPLIDFPVLLAFPPNSVPQPIPLCALIHLEEQSRAMVTLLLPNEVAATIIPMN